MKITIVNTSDLRGGAAIASFRLFKALHKQLPETRMLVREKISNLLDIKGMNNTFFQRILNKFFFLFERLFFIPRAKDKEFWFSFSPANFGQNIDKYPEVLNADIIHLHWVQMGFLSIKSIEKLIKTNKPIVWTLHDMWAFTGGCHYPGMCTGFIHNCGNCYFLKYPYSTDLSYRIHKQKLELISGANITFIAVSNWMAENAKKSSLAGNSRIVVLPNPIDTNIYKPADKFQLREELGLPKNRFLILSGAANLKDKRKGFVYLSQALDKMKSENPDLSNRFGLITFGKSSFVSNSNIPVFSQSYLKEDELIAKLYQAADVFVLPTLEDNLPSTVMESLACGTPVVAFNTGGIPDMIDHKITGYLAELKNIDDLIKGIYWVKDHPEIGSLKEKCRNKVLQEFSSEVVALKYIDFYQNILNSTDK